MINLTKYSDKTILIVGGGTSTLDRKWEDLPYDYLWTCNKFYNQPRVLNQKVDLISLGTNSDIDDKVLINKVKAERPIVIAEPNHISIDRSDILRFNTKTGVTIRNFNINLPTGVTNDTPASRSGSAFRLILLAMQTNAKEILFVGFDGFTSDYSNKHAFTGEVGPRVRERIFSYNDPGQKYSIVSRFSDAFSILSLLPGSYRLQNLGEGLPYNIGTSISKRFFPLKTQYK